MKTGIESMGFYVPRYYLDLKTLAARRGVDADKFYKGLGQERMAVAPVNEDVVTLAANAGADALQDIPLESIDTLIFATESGIDQSKAGGVYVHKLLGLPSSCKAFEIKQACSSGTAGLMMALSYVRQFPERRVLLIAADIARYGLGTAGEPTQGAGAVAMVISAHPRILAIDPEHGSYTADVMDFWRPNYMDEALVDGKYSIRVYLRALSACWKLYAQRTGQSFGDFDRFCYHLPFTRMAEKAHQHLAKINKVENLSNEELQGQIEASLQYNRMTGNLYTGSLYAGLLSLLESKEDMTGKRLGMFSYGSGCLAYFFGAEVQQGYRAALNVTPHHAMLDAREELDMDRYERMYEEVLPKDGSCYQTPDYLHGEFVLKGVENHRRQYAIDCAQADETADYDCKKIVNAKACPVEAA